MRNVIIKYKNDKYGKKILKKIFDLRIHGIPLAIWLIFWIFLSPSPNRVFCDEKFYITVKGVYDMQRNTIEINVNKLRDPFVLAETVYIICMEHRLPLIGIMDQVGRAIKT